MADDRAVDEPVRVAVVMIGVVMVVVVVLFSKARNELRPLWQHEVPV